ncbi:MAG TPA: serine hydrolase domain-containing protein [Stackebrandtia sp.]|jgi:CubicO group peptidase (beta-lactamase class C family)|uniref:serine hydrolase domain-containing protein n=1 Tax=Stackebrandtia sp. TaxID=2023065 RepID=UPI002D4698E9|nr:serine hydrolase domain-containing protein [Stackebrandtia sp.]HZE39627.1 serine hydrolase domain-containing protein [Stackebrandtia sp.]
MTSLPEVQGNVLLVRQGRVLHQASNGFADPVSRTPLTPDTRFQIASISKQFTAAATLLLVDAGKLSLNDSIRRWFPEAPAAWDPITPHHLLTHTSGLGHWPDYEDLCDICAYSPAEEILHAFYDLPLVQPVGEGFRYSSPGFWLLARITELASGTPYREFLDRRIFEPLQLTSTFAGNGGDRPLLAVGCGPDGPLDELFDLDGYGMGAGDLWSTTTDLVTWNQALDDGRILSEDSRRLMFHPFVDTKDALPGDYQYYGYGWFVGTLDGHDIRVHTGGNAGFQSVNAWFPEYDTHFVHVTSRDDFFKSSGLTLDGLLLTHLNAALSS